MTSHGLGSYSVRRLVSSAGFDGFGLALAFSENQLHGALGWLEANVGAMIERG